MDFGKANFVSYGTLKLRSVVSFVVCSTKLSLRKGFLNNINETIDSEPGPDRVGTPRCHKSDSLNSIPTFQLQPGPGCEVSPDKELM